MSFLATLGLVYFNPILTRVLKVEKWQSKILKTIFGDYFLTTLSAIILTTPIILYDYGKLSLVAPLANILVLPAIPLAMLLGFIACLLAIIFLPMGQIAGWLVWLVLSYIIWILEKLAHLPWAAWQVPKINSWLLALLYVLILGLVITFKPIKKSLK